MSQLPPPSLPPTIPGMAAAPAQSWWKRRLWKLPVWAWIVIGLFGIGTIGNLVSPQKEKSTANATEITDSTDAAESSDESIAATSTTRKPTTTTAQATTTAATTTTLAPTTTVPPPPVVLTGHGPSVVALPDGEPYVAEITHSGNSNFVIWTLDAGLNQTDLLVNEIGRYAGRLPLNFAGGTVSLEIDGDGDWSITLVPVIDGARVIGSGISGSGSDVLFVSDVGVFSVTHDGSSNFVVWIYTADDTDLLVNEIGAFSGDIPLRGPGFVVVDADGNWSFTPK